MQMKTAEQLAREWQDNPRWRGVTRGYKAEDVVRLRGTVHVEHSLARHGAEKLWRHMSAMPFVNALGALTGNQAMQQVRAGLKAIYLSGWQVAGDANLAGEMYPDQSLVGSTAPCCVPISCTTPRAMTPSIGCNRSWPMPKRVSVAYSMPSNS
jgi:isocitrate lyase